MTNFFKRLIYRITSDKELVPVSTVLFFVVGVLIIIILLATIWASFIAREITAIRIRSILFLLFIMILFWLLEYLDQQRS